MMPPERKSGTPDSLSGLRSQVFQVAHTMRLPIVDKEVIRCLHWSWSESYDLWSVVLFCFTEGVSCSSDPEGECQCMLSLNPVLIYWGRESEWSSETIAVTQVRICHNLFASCTYVHMPSQAIWAKVGQLTEARGTVSHKERYTSHSQHRTCIILVTSIGT